MLYWPRGQTRAHPIALLSCARAHLMTNTVSRAGNQLAGIRIGPILVAEDNGWRDARLTKPTTLGGDASQPQWGGPFTGFSQAPSFYC